MRRFYFGFFGVFTLTYLAYLTWLTGYRAGYDEGANKAWDNARKALAPQVMPVTKSTTSTIPTTISTNESVVATERE